VKVHRVVCAVDCGRYVNPDTIAAQMEGSIVFWLTAALKGQITIAKGRVEQSNFHDYEMLRMNETPRQKFTLCRATSRHGGGRRTRNAADRAAVCNAIFAATGKPIRAAFRKRKIWQ